MPPPTSIFGAALLGMSFDDAEATSRVLDSLVKAGVTHIDTAARYPPLNQGQSERLLGQAHAASRGFSIDSKILMSHGNSGGELQPSAIITSLENSLGRLGSPSVSSTQEQSFSLRMHQLPSRTAPWSNNALSYLFLFHYKFKLLNCELIISSFQHS